MRETFHLPVCLSLCVLVLFGCGGLFPRHPVQLTCWDLSLSLKSPTTVSLICFLLSSSFPSPCSSGVTPLILIYLMKCLKPLCGNPSTPIKKTFVQWQLRRQGRTLFSSPLSSGNTTATHCRHSLLLCFAPSCNFQCRAPKLCSVTCKFWVCVFSLCRIEGIAFIDEWRMPTALADSAVPLDCSSGQQPTAIWLLWPSASSVLRETSLNDFYQLTANT